MADTDNNRKVLLLVSGGPDSATLAKLAEQELKTTGGHIAAIYLKTGHPQDEAEIEAANRVASLYNIQLEIIDITSTVRALGADRPMIHSEASIMRFGNAYVLSITMAYAFKAGYDEIWIGLHADDAKESREYTRPYIDHLEEMAQFAYGHGPSIKTPFLQMSKIDVFKLGKELGVDYGMTWSCIRGEKNHCGVCGACRSRRRAFNHAGIVDPTTYDIEPFATDSVA